VLIALPETAKKKAGQIMAGFLIIESESEA
jgi:hypothetical protein